MKTIPANVHARNTLALLFLGLLILDAFLIFLSKDLWAIGRIIFTAIIMYLVLQGHLWAKWMLVGILSLVVVALVSMLALLSKTLSALISIGSVAMAILCCVIMVYLIGDNNLQQYFATKRDPKRRLM